MPDLTHARVLSVDLFDTLLLRAVPRPIDAFPLVAGRALERAALRPHVAPAQFAAVRHTAEGQARLQSRTARGTLEVTLPEIYRAMPDAWFPAGIEPLPRLELDTECELAHPHAGVLALVQDARGRGIPVVVTSDTYFSGSDLADLLAHAGIPPSWFAHIFASSDYGVSKHDGRLFARVCSRFPHVPAAAIHHVGDHPHADVQQATRAGLTAILHDNGQAALRPVIRLESLRHGTVAPALQSLRAMAATMEAPADPDLAWWFGLGASTLGPAFAVFADWVLDQCARDGITTVRPLMREGALFTTLIGRAAAARHMHVDVAPLYASRSATWLAGLDSVDQAAVAVLLQRSHLTVREALQVVGLDVEAAGGALAPFAAVTLAEAATMPAPDGRVVADWVHEALGARGAQAAIARHLAEQRTALCQYVEQACGQAGTVALVDLGFHGSTGRAIRAATRHTSSREYVQLLAFGAEGLTRAWARGEDIRVFGAGPTDNADLAGPITRHPAVLEALLVEGGTTAAYVRDGEAWVPQLEPARAPAAQQAAAKACRDGILAFQARWLGWAAARPAMAHAVADDRRSLVAPIHRLLTMPTAAEAARLGDWVHEDNEGGDAVRPLTAPDAVPGDVTPRTFMRATASGSRAWGVAWAWPAGTCERRWPGHLEDIWQDAAGSADGAPPAVQVLATRLQREGVRSCHMWGAGEVGLAMLRALRQSDVKVGLVVDSNPALHGTLLEGVPVVSPDEARGHGADVFVIASFAFAREIEERLRSLYADAARALRIVHPTLEATL